MSEPITLSGAQFDELLNALMQRDPLIAGLLQMQQAAQTAKVSLQAVEGVQKNG